MGQLFLTYNDNKKLQPLVGEISWTHNLIILGKCKNELERKFYIPKTIRSGWSKIVLISRKK